MGRRREKWSARKNTDGERHPGKRTGSVKNGEAVTKRQRSRNRGSAERFHELLVQRQSCLSCCS
jgi:hypothetical protein